MLTHKKGNKMLRILPDEFETANNDDNFKIEELKKQLKIEMMDLGVDEDFLRQNFVIFNVKEYNEGDIKKEDVVDHAIQLLENVATLFKSIQYFKQSNIIEDLILELSEDN